jgi:hypothetical protein
MKRKMSKVPLVISEVRRSERPKVNIKASNPAPMQVKVVSAVTPTLLQYPKK